MKEKIILNYHLLDWISTTITAVIESSIEETPDKVSTIISVNNMLNNLDIKTEFDVIKTLSEKLTDKIFEEIQNII